MRRFADPIVEFPFDKSHKMLLPRLQQHLCRCKAKQQREDAQMPNFHCKFNFLHIFFDEKEYQEHKVECQKVKNKINAKYQSGTFVKIWGRTTNDSDDSRSETVNKWDSKKVPTNKTPIYWGKELYLAAKAPELTTLSSEYNESLFKDSQEKKEQIKRFNHLCAIVIFTTAF